MYPGLELKRSIIIVTLVLSIFVITVLADNHIVSAQDFTVTHVFLNPSTAPIGSIIHFKATVTDTNDAKITPIGTVSWDDNGAGGTFSSSTCTLVPGTKAGVSACTVTYTAANLGTITITATYSGDTLHDASSGSSSLTSTVRSSTTAVYPNPAATSIGKPIIFKGKVSDSAIGTKVTPTGTVSWSDNGAGGTFSSGTCTLATVTTGVSACTVTYTPANLGTITITGTYSSDTLHSGSSSTSVLTSTTRTSSTIVLPSSVSSPVGKPITFKGKVADSTLGNRIAPTGTESWSDNGAGGTFSSSTCTLAIVTTGVSACTVTYIPATMGPITITATYSGDTTHAASSGASSLTSTVRSSATGVFPNPATSAIGKPIIFKGKVADSTPGTKATPIGTISWSDNGAGGTFSSSTCTLATVTTGVSACTVTYTPAILGTITITATYSGDTVHAASSGASSLTVT
jgi:hypothetical protein